MDGSVVATTAAGSGEGGGSAVGSTRCGAAVTAGSALGDAATAVGAGVTLQLLLGHRKLESTAKKPGVSPRSKRNAVGRRERQAIGLSDVNYSGRPAGTDRTRVVASGFF